MNRLTPLLQKTTSVYYMTVTFDGDYVSANDHFLERFQCYGLADGTLHVKDTIVDEDWSKVEHCFNECMANPGVPQPLTIRKPIVSGEIVHTSWEFIADSDAKQIDCIGFDISSRVSLSKRVLEFAERINAIVDSITDGFYNLDRDWKFVLVNQVFLDIVGMKREEVIGKSLWDVFPDDDGFNYPSKYRKAMEEGIAQKFEDYRPDLDRWFWAAAYPSEEGLIVYFKDITRRKKDSDELIGSRNKLSAILNSTSESHVLMDKNYQIVSYNRVAALKAKELFGITMKKGTSMMAFTMPHTVDQFMQDFKTALSGKLVSNEVPIEFPDSSVRWFRIEQSPAYDDQNKIIGVVFNSIDIDNLKQYERQLEETNERLRNIAHKQSHEMRSPIARIIGLISLLKQSPGDKEVMAHVEEVANELDVIIHDIIEQTEEA